LLEECYKKYKPELTRTEKNDFWKSSLRFYIEKEGGILNLKFDDSEKDPVREYIAKELEEMADSTAQDFEVFLEDVLDQELPKLIDSFVDKVEDLGNEIKKSLESEKKE